VFFVSFVFQIYGALRAHWVSGSSPAMTKSVGGMRGFSLRAFDRFDDLFGGVGEVVGGDEAQA
jgi:hypothetical protein